MVACGGEALIALAGGAPTLALALLCWWLDRRDDRTTIRQLRDDNGRLLEALNLAINGRLR